MKQIFHDDFLEGFLSFCQRSGFSKEASVRIFRKFATSRLAGDVEQFVGDTTELMRLTKEAAPVTTSTNPMALLPTTVPGLPQTGSYPVMPPPYGAPPQRYADIQNRISNQFQQSIANMDQTDIPGMAAKSRELMPSMSWDEYKRQKQQELGEDYNRSGFFRTWGREAGESVKRPFRWAGRFFTDYIPGVLKRQFGQLENTLSGQQRKLEPIPGMGWGDVSQNPNQAYVDPRVAEYEAYRKRTAGIANPLEMEQHIRQRDLLTRNMPWANIHDPMLAQRYQDYMKQYMAQPGVTTPVMPGWNRGGFGGHTAYPYATVPMGRPTLYTPPQ